jgi:hypothetical protein
MPHASFFIFIKTTIKIYNIKNNISFHVKNNCFFIFINYFINIINYNKNKNNIYNTNNNNNNNILNNNISSDIPQESTSPGDTSFVGNLFVHFLSLSLKPHAQ